MKMTDDKNTLSISDAENGVHHFRCSCLSGFMDCDCPVTKGYCIPEKLETALDLRLPEGVRNDKRDGKGRPALVRRRNAKGLYPLAQELSKMNGGDGKVYFCCPNYAVIRVGNKEFTLWMN